MQPSPTLVGHRPKPEPQPMRQVAGICDRARIEAEQRLVGRPRPVTTSAAKPSDAGAPRRSMG
jgi:hypothetical protein